MLGGGGIAGIAWEIGILLGLHDAGIDLSAAERIVGTSAGAAVGGQVTSGRPLAELFERQVAPGGLSHEISADLDAEEMWKEFGQILTTAKPGAELGRAIGAYALGATTVTEAARRRVIEARLPTHDWPDRDLRIVTVDATTGEPRIFTAADGVPLVDAVAASCAVPGVWPPVTIGSARYIDGGARSTTNSDLASGCDPIVVIAPMPDFPIVARDVRAAIDGLNKHAAVVVIRPDEASTAAMGANPLDPASAPPSAEAGRAQAADHVSAVAEIWGEQSQ